MINVMNFLVIALKICILPPSLALSEVYRRSLGDRTYTSCNCVCIKVYSCACVRVCARARACVCGCVILIIFIYILKTEYIHTLLH